MWGDIMADLKDMTNRRKHFNALYSYFKKDLEKLTLKELLWKVYNQACCDCGIDATEISMEELNAILETETFVDFVRECIANPSEMKKLPQNDYVKVTWECSPEDKLKCVAFPDRCDDVCSEEKRTTIVNLSKLCGIDSDKDETLDDKLLTEDEIKELARALENAEN